MAEHQSEPTPEQIDAAKLHATAWEHASSSLMRNADDPDASRRMGMTQEQLKALGWLALAVGGGYRRIVNGAKLAD